ncbi:ABC transporter ATP-binding protein [Rhodobium gokarnense]|uniref:Branched-chain amino acid transport system ATP-binding protein n=1 Tax=Rhodobium gokarnense TaxID=364296 RepID=A0ABT3HBQ6_9HYPH|nr:ABC transporter ATP-binding protein [Rhodobium gokarnense]MCW2307815.1 branched-chain amino acid transport system ATP-binding protein [Rhodobium gokarnense]
MFLAVEGLTKWFGSVKAVRGIDFGVARGEIVALVGPNGAGKTTCFNIVAGAMRPSAGTVRLDGADVTGHPPEEMAARGLARTFQIMRPMAGMTVLENALIGPLARGLSLQDARSDARYALERVGLAEKADSPAGLLTLPERKMLELARALSTAPRLLLLDEVMASLRPAEADRIVALLQSLRAEGLTILLIEHVMRVVMSLADRVVVMHHGEKIAEGAPAEIAADRAVIDNYLGRRTAP